MKIFFKITKSVIILAACVAVAASCKKENPKSSACEIIAFTVNGVDWDVSATNITHTYPTETTEGQLTPVISLSPGATVSPASGSAQNFFTQQGVSYTVTAEDGVTKETYIAKAVRTKNNVAEIVRFKVGDVEWDISGENITHTYPTETTEGLLTPVITLSPGAMVSPESGSAQNFFTSQGVSYTVTAEDGVTKETYIAKAVRTKNNVAEIVRFKVGDVEWDISGENITHTYHPAETAEGQLTPVITLSPGATVSPASGSAQNFFTPQGVTYTVTAEDGVTKKTYNAKVLIFISGVTGDCTWTLTGVPGNYTLTISGNGEMADYYKDLGGRPWHDYEDDIKTVLIQEGVTVIGEYAFYYFSGLTSLTIPNSVTTIDIDAFHGCSRLTSLTIGNSVTDIGTWAFYDCSSLTSLTIPNSVTYIGSDAFYGCSGLTTVSIPNSVIYIRNPFGGCSNLMAINVEAAHPRYSSVDGVLFNKEQTILVAYPGGKNGDYSIPNSVTAIEDGAFKGCSGLTSVTIPNSVTEITESAFEGCRGLTSVTIPNSVTTIYAHVFEDCSGLTSVTIGNSVRYIGAWAFENCSGLTTVTIGNSVETIGNYAFRSCNGLITVTNLNPVPPNINNAFYNIPINNCTLRVPASALGAYRAAPVWKDFGTIVAIE